MSESPLKTGCQPPTPAPKIDKGKAVASKSATASVSR